MLAITLYGMQSSLYRHLKAHVQQVAAEAKIKLSITEVNDLNVFLKESIPSIPTIRLGLETRSYTKENENIFIQEVKQWLLLKANTNINMKEITIPIDFSSGAMNALNFAKNIASYTNASLNLVHCYYPSPIKNRSQVDPQLEITRRQALDSFKDKFALKNKKENKSIKQLNTKFLVGFPGEELVTVSKITDIIIMGSNGANNAKSLLGSVSTDLCANSHCPVIIVPPDAKYTVLNKLIFCSGHQSVDIQSLNELVSFVMPFSPKIEVVHVDDGSQYDESDIMKKLASLYLPDKISYRVLKGKSVATTLMEYGKVQNADMMILNKTSRGFIEKMLHPSITKKLIVNTNIPTLILNQQNKN